MPQKTKENSKSNKNRLFVIVGSLIFLLGVFIYVFNIYHNNQLDLNDKNLADDFINNNEEFRVQEMAIPDEISTEKVEDIKEVNQSQSNSYIGVLEIPKITLKRGFYDTYNINNNVNKNIQVIKDSNMPNVEKGNLILAAHSGSGRVAFFKNIYKLNNNDEIFIYFNGKKYKYQVGDKYEVDKSGRVLIHRDKDITALTLTTCSQTDKTKQIVVIAKLVEEVLSE